MITATNSKVNNPDSDTNLKKKRGKKTRNSSRKRKSSSHSSSPVLTEREKLFNRTTEFISLERGMSPLVLSILEEKMNGGGGDNSNNVEFNCLMESTLKSFHENQRLDYLLTLSLRRLPQGENILDYMWKSDIAYSLFTSSFHGLGVMNALGEILRPPILKILRLSKKHTFLHVNPTTGEELVVEKKLLALTSFLLGKLQDGLEQIRIQYQEEEANNNNNNNNNNEGLNSWSIFGNLCDLLDQTFPVSPRTKQRHYSISPALLGVSHLFFLRALAPLLLFPKTYGLKPKVSKREQSMLRWIASVTLRAFAALITGEESNRSSGRRVEASVESCCDALLDMTEIIKESGRSMKVRSKKFITNFSNDNNNNNNIIKGNEVYGSPLVTAMMANAVECSHALGSSTMAEKKWNKLVLQLQEKAGVEPQLSYQDVWKKAQEKKGEGRMFIGVQSASSRSDKVTKNAEKSERENDTAEMNVEQYIPLKVMEEADDIFMTAETTAAMGEENSSSEGTLSYDDLSEMTVLSRTNSLTSSASSLAPISRQVILKTQLQGKTKLVRLNIDENSEMNDIVVAISTAFNSSHNNISIDKSVDDILFSPTKIVKVMATSN